MFELETLSLLLSQEPFEAIERRRPDSEVYPLNLMLFTGLLEAGWEASWYGAVEGIPRSRQGAGAVAEGRRAALNRVLST